MEKHTGKRPGVVRLVLRSMFETADARRWRRGLSTTLALLGFALIGAVYAFASVPGATEAVEDPAADVETLLTRAERTAERLYEAEDYVRREVLPIERVLLRYRDDPVLVRRVALALVREARAVELEPRLLLAVLLVENPWLDPTATSSVGARGLMQVMPLHRGHWPCEPNLQNVESNICHGAKIFAHYFRSENGDVERALLRYNGCVNGTNTPDCHRYPYHVYARAGRASILAWLEPSPVRAASP